MKEKLKKEKRDINGEIVFTELHVIVTKKKNIFNFKYFYKPFLYAIFFYSLIKQNILLTKGINHNLAKGDQIYYCKM